MTKCLLTLVLLFIVGCPPKDPVLPPPNPPVDTDLCGEMCTHLKSLGCEEGDDVYNNDIPGPVDEPNQSCEDWCAETQDKGVSINPRCVSQVESCEDIEVARHEDPESCKDDPAPDAG